MMAGTMTKGSLMGLMGVVIGQKGIAARYLSGLGRCLSQFVYWLDLAGRCALDMDPIQRYWYVEDDLV